jgi:transposase
MRLIYVADKNSKLPIYFRYMTANINDNSILFTILNTLLPFNLKIDLSIIDIDYFSHNNLEQLIKNNISYLAIIPKHRAEYKELMAEHGPDLICGQNSFTYHDRALFGKKVPINLFNTVSYAYIILDLLEYHDELKEKIINYENNPNKPTAIKEFNNSAELIILLSAKDNEISDILSLYYFRQIIEQVFDINTLCSELTPPNNWSKEIFNGNLLVLFIATVIHSYLDNKLSDLNISSYGALKYMHNILIKIYDSIALVEELPKIQKEIFNHLGLACPFEFENPNPPLKAPFLKPSEKKKGDRPKETKSQPKPSLAKDA